MTTTHKFDFKQFQNPSYLSELDDDFLHTLRSQNSQLHSQLKNYRQNADALSPIETSEMLVGIAPFLEHYIAELFSITESLSPLQQATLINGSVSEFGNIYLKKRVRRLKGDSAWTFSELGEWLSKEIKSNNLAVSTDEQAIATLGLFWLENETEHTESIEKLTRWCQFASDEENIQAFSEWISFKTPNTVDPAHLVPLESITNVNIEATQGPAVNHRPRDGFALTDQRMSLEQIMYEVHYCKYCHDHQGDFCSTGFLQKKTNPELGLKKNTLGVTLTGCPLEEKISEMNLLKRQGYSIGSLAVAMIDNPMIPATGHRICNDCMKACIYQKRDPVNIPEIETRVLTDVLELDWGVEIYDLLTRWNPLRNNQYIIKPYNGYKVLISGQGPAGFTMAHHLSMEGCGVVGIDGLKIEFLPDQWFSEPIKHFSEMQENLDSRLLAGFGGVAEYGITTRWDKNFLRLIYLVLSRRSNIQFFGATRLGGSIKVEDAWELGFDHLCIAHGAGLPRVVHMGDSLARGMRQASDFLMALQLTGAAKKDSLAHLQIRLPAVVIGGGLTAIDTATEVQAYYIAQVEKTLFRYEELVNDIGQDSVVNRLDNENKAILEEFIEHGRLVRAERELATKEKREPELGALVRQWGGVTVLYRRGINNSPAYLRNHEEVIKALQEGIFYLEGIEPANAELDEFGHVESLCCTKRKLDDGKWLTTNESIRIPARAVLTAAGTFPNTIYESEYPGTFQMEHDHFLPYIAHHHGDQAVDVADHCKSQEFGPFTSYNKDDKRISFIGDTHPVFHGSVVKAIASAARSYPAIIESLNWQKANSTESIDLVTFQDHIRYQLTTVVDSVDNTNPMVTELFIKAPLAAKNFKPGQFFRLQTYESCSEVIDGTRLQVPLQTISGAGVKGDLIRLLLLKWGSNAKLVARLNSGDPLALMGPTGQPNNIKTGKTVMVVAGSWGAAVMLDLGPALRAAGNKVLYIAAYGEAEQVYHKQELEAASDSMIWAVSKGELISADRPEDASVMQGNMVELIKAYSEGKIQTSLPIDLKEVDEIMVMGSSGLLTGLQQAFKQDFSQLFKDSVEIHGTVGSPMQCMMKGVCGQCLQWQINPDTGERTRTVFSCSQQDQPLMQIDIENLIARQSQNRLSEHLTNLWVDKVLRAVEQ